MPIGFGNRFALIVAVAAILSAVLAIFFWVVPHSVLGWLALLIIGIAAWLFLEWFGETALSMPLFQRLSNPMRIFIGIPVMIALMAVALLVSLLVKKIVLAL